MANIVQTSYDSVLGRANVALLGVHLQRSAITAAQTGRWNAHRFPCWTMVWSGVQGYQARLATSDGSDRVVDRIARSWALHGPDQLIQERLPGLEADRESMYLFFRVDGELPVLASRPLTIVVDNDDRLAERFRDMHRAQQRGGPGDALVAHGLLLASLGEIIACAHDSGAGDDDSPWRLRSADEPASAIGLLAAVDLQVARTPAAPPSRARLAKALGMSESSLAHRFRAETGMTLVERIRWLRIREAKARLAEPGATVKSVAASLGFSSPSYFSRVFTEVAALTPEEYLRRCAR